MRFAMRVALVAILLNGCALAAQPIDHDKFLAWHKEMTRVPLPKKGCFKCIYPTKEWVEEECAKPKDRPPQLPPELFLLAPAAGMAGGPSRNPTAEVASGLISTSIGSFDGAPLTNETDPGKKYSLQLNSQFFDTPACVGAADPAKCKGWQQFVYHPDNSGFIQYWLLDYRKQACEGLPDATPCQCPKGWIASSKSHCFRFSRNGTRPGDEPVSDLIHLSLGGTAVAGGNDVLTVATARFGVIRALNEDNILGLACGWKSAEFGVFGPGRGATLQFSAGATIAVRTHVDNGTTDVPNCVMERFTGEKHNLQLVSCCSFGGKAPSIVFCLSNDPDPASACADARDPRR